jgi:hypothetical protein
MPKKQGRSGLFMRVRIEGLCGERLGTSERFVRTEDYRRWLEGLWHRKVTVIESKPVFW